MNVFWGRGERVEEGGKVIKLQLEMLFFVMSPKDVHVH